MKPYNYLIIGSGLFGSVFAYEMHLRGKRCLVLEKRQHIGGNIYTEKREDIQVHVYGAHIFHTSNKQIWDYINRLRHSIALLMPPWPTTKINYLTSLLT